MKFDLFQCHSDPARTFDSIPDTRILLSPDLINRPELRTIVPHNFATRASVSSKLTLYATKMGLEPITTAPNLETCSVHLRGPSSGHRVKSSCAESPSSKRSFRPLSLVHNGYRGEAGLCPGAASTDGYTLAGPHLWCRLPRASRTRVSSHSPQKMQRLRSFRLAIAEK